MWPILYMSVVCLHEYLANKYMLTSVNQKVFDFKIWAKQISLCRSLLILLQALYNNDVIMSAMASQITSITIVYSTVYSGTEQRKHQSSASLAFVWGIHRWPVNSPHKWPVTRKMFHLMTSSCVRARFAIGSAMLFCTLLTLTNFSKIERLRTHSQ